MSENTENNTDNKSLVEQRQTGFLVIPSDENDSTPDDYPNGGPLDVASVMDNLDHETGESNPFINAYFGQLVFDASNNSYYYWSVKTNAPTGGWKKLI